MNSNHLIIRSWIWYSQLTRRMWFNHLTDSWRLCYDYLTNKSRKFLNHLTNRSRMCYNHLTNYIRMWFNRLNNSSRLWYNHFTNGSRMLFNHLTTSSWIRFNQFTNSSIITNYSQQDWIYFYRVFTYFRRFLCPSSGAHNCTQLQVSSTNTAATCYRRWDVTSILCTVAVSSSIGWQYLKLYVLLCAPDDGQRNRQKHVESL